MQLLAEKWGPRMKPQRKASLHQTATVTKLNHGSTQSRFQKANFFRTATSKRGVGLGWRASPQHPTHTLGGWGDITTRTTFTKHSSSELQLSEMLNCTDYSTAGRKVSESGKAGLEASFPTRWPGCGAPEMARLLPALEPSTPYLNISQVTAIATN